MTAVCVCIKRWGTMADTILVLNAGSSSIKFSLFAEAGSELALVARGQIEGIDTSPHFIAQDANGQMASEQRWAPPPEPCCGWWSPRG